MSGQIRDASEADVEAIVELTASGWKVAYQGIVPAEHLEKLPYAGWRHDITAGLRAPVADSFTRVAELDGSPVGYCYVAAPGRDEPEGSRVAEVVAIYVDPAQWRRGVGRALMADVDAVVEAGDYEEMTLWTFERNAQARAFYARLGWAPDGERKPHEATGVPIIRLRRSLNSPE